MLHTGSVGVGLFAGGYFWLVSFGGVLCVSVWGFLFKKQNYYQVSGLLNDVHMESEGTVLLPFQALLFEHY